MSVFMDEINVEYPQREKRITHERIPAHVFGMWWMIRVIKFEGCPLILFNAKRSNHIGLITSK
jgi:hypothetical protein